MFTEQQSVIKFIVNFVTPKASVVGLPNNYVSLMQHNSVNKIIFLPFVILATSKAGAKHELLFYKPASANNEFSFSFICG